MKLEIRAVQLDLARQIENIDFIKQFCGFIADNGFNTLVLYLEGRIRTSSFPYPAENESYSVDEMKGIVEHATGLGLDIIPVVSTLGHAEMFLQYSEMNHIAELRDGSNGRFHNSRAKHVFCPSLSATYNFLEAYLTELADIFPSAYFHVGCDESWDIGCCDLCKQRLDKGETQADIFAAHLKASYDIITSKLGRRMLMWDDMFEQYPEALEILPKDIVMCTWDYSTVPDLPVGHFNNGRRNDPFACYDKNGFDYIFSTGSTLPNIDLFTAYANRYKPLGGLVTIWGLKDAFMYRRLPAIAYAGRLWDGDGNGVDFSDIVNEIFSIAEPEFTTAIKTVASGFGVHVKRSVLDRRMEYPDQGENYAGKAVVSLLVGALARFCGKAKTPLGNIVLEDIYTTLEQIIIQNEIEDFIPALSPDAADNQIDLNEADDLELRCTNIASKRIDQWGRWRAGITPCYIKEFFENLVGAIGQIPKNDIADGFMQVYFFLPDIYGSPTCSFLVKYKDSETFELLATGNYKASDSQGPFYSKRIPLPHDRVPESVKVEVWGYGGHGFTYLTLQNKTGHYVPSGISNIVGNVSNPEFILDYDRKWSFAGSQDVRQAVINRDIANKKHSFVIELTMVIKGEIEK